MSIKKRWTIGRGMKQTLPAHVRGKNVVKRESKKQEEEKPKARAGCPWKRMCDHFPDGCVFTNDDYDECGEFQRLLQGSYREAVLRAKGTRTYGVRPWSRK